MRFEEEVKEDARSSKHFVRCTRTRFEAEPAIFVAPGRVNLIGEHTDYAEGFVMPAAINFATLAGISPRTDGKIAIYSENQGEEKVFDGGAGRKGSEALDRLSDGRGVRFLPARATRFPAFSLSIWSDVPLCVGAFELGGAGSGDGAGGAVADRRQLSGPGAGAALPAGGERVCGRELRHHGSVHQRERERRITRCCWIAAT